MVVAVLTRVVAVLTRVVAVLTTVVAVLECRRFGMSPFLLLPFRLVAVMTGTRVMLILEYISTHGTPEWCAVRMSARESKGRLPAYEQPCTSCTGACWLYAWREGPTPAG